MLKRTIFFVFVLVVFNNISYSQDLNNLQEINKVWVKFCKAFKTKDHQLFADIHSKNLIRIAGGSQISNYDVYMEGNKAYMERSKNKNVTESISLRFFERVSNDSIASERGVFKVVRNKNKPEERIYYGQFHVLLKKENGSWKIFMDYDSNEKGTIDAEDFNKAYELNDLEKFTQQ